VVEDSFLSMGIIIKLSIQVELTAGEDLIQVHKYIFNHWLGDNSYHDSTWDKQLKWVLAS
jgi:hypothetical protein